jgi:outer membrane protein assembly factor BamB
MIPGLSFSSILFVAFSLGAAPDLKEELWSAAKKGDVKAVKDLLDKGVDVNAATEYGVTALSYAAEKGHSEVVKLLLANKANVNTKDTFYKSSPLEWALNRKNNDEIILALVEAGADDADGALASAVRASQIKQVQALLKTGKIKEDGLTKALAATKPEQKEIIEGLTKAGAKAPPKVEAVVVPKEVLETYAGSYRADGAGEIKVVLTNGVLAVEMGGNSNKLVPVDKTKFTLEADPKSSLEFKSAEGKVTGMISKREKSEMIFTRETPKPVAGPTLTREAQKPVTVEKPANWPSFRGKNAFGVADGQQPPTFWDTEKGDNVLWKTPIPGLGHSCPVVWEDRLFVTSAISGDQNASLRPGLYGDVDSVKDDTEHTWHVYCLDKKTGKIVWDQTAQRGIPKVKRHLKSSQANPTVATDGKYVIAFFGSEGLYCYDIAGKPLWKNDFGVLDSGWFIDGDYQWGFGSSPILYRDRVFIQCDIGKGSFLAAYRLTDGKQIWKTPREEIPSWGTPTIVESPERVELVTNATKFARSYDPDSGSELWKLARHSEITVPTPIFAQGLIFITSGYRPVQPIYAIKPGAKGDISLSTGKTTNDFIAWSVEKGGPYMPTPIVYGEHLYTCSNSGMLTCYEAKTGKKLYQERLGGTAAYTASPVAADGKLYFTSEEKGVRVVKAGPKFELLAVNPMNEICMATPAIADGMIFIRGQHHLFGIGRPEWK